ncbi:VgrG-related protein [Microbacterium sp. SS28]|uniref:VgrG-related protein n=1 Tax=Microbacterium sp. SS28 TaxID=2919948 RepID=UPI001FA9487A|nr:VgrG-related protein [Microbacterium sp. SS28]
MPALDTYTSLLVVQVDGSDLPTDVSSLLVRGRITDGVGLPDSFELDFADEHGIVAPKFPIAGAVKLKVSQNGPTPERVLFEGEVTALEREDVGGSLHTRVRGLDGAARLMRGTRVAAFVDSTIADIVRRVAQNAGLTVGTVEAPSGVLPHVAQDNVSDWTFLARLARIAGATFTVTGKRLDFGPPTPARDAPAASSARDNPVVIEHGANAQYVRAVVTAAEQVSRVSVRGWDPAAKKVVVSTADARTRSADIASLTPAAIAKKVGSRELADLSGEGRAASQDKLAASLADRLAGGFAEVEAQVTGNPEIRCGVAVTLTGFGAPFDGRYTVSETVHDFSSVAGYATTAVVSNMSDRSLFGVAGAGVALQEARIPGVVTAVVTDNQDPDDAGRVKLEFPFASDDYVSGWARTVHTGAGKERGLVVLPEIGDEVLVAFDQGFFDRPIVLGGLFNGKDVPAGGWRKYVDSKGVLRRALVSRTGMRVELVEDGSAESVQLTTNDGAQRITVRQDGGKGVEIVSEGPVSVTAKTDVKVTTDTGKVEVSASTITLSAKEKLELSAPQVALKGTAKVELSAPQIAVKADAQAELSASGAVTVKGAIVKIN